MHVLRAFEVKTVHRQRAKQERKDNTASSKVSTVVYVVRDVHRKV